MPKNIASLYTTSAHTLTGLHDPKLQRTLKEDKKYLETTALPIVTVSATYKEDLKGLHHLPELDSLPDIVLSRAHYSMTLGVAIQAWGKKIDPKKAWIVDPTNYVSHKDWKSIQITEVIGKTLARHPILKKLKDLVDKFGRQKLPILASITPPLEYLTRDIPNSKPILSLHITAGNILAKQGKTIIQVITDPHVREDYLAHAELPNMSFCVFDKKTKTEFLEKAAILGKKVDSTQVVVTGPPVDPRIIKARKNKKPWTPKIAKKTTQTPKYSSTQVPVKLCLTTGGLGTNKTEIETVLRRLLPELRKKNPRYQLMIHAATHADIRQLVLDLAQENRVKVHEIHPTDPANFETGEKIDSKSPDYFSDPEFLKKNSAGTKHAPEYQITNLPNYPLTLLYHPQIVDANELLIRHAFPWADGFITKPSGDMAYDAVAAGCFLLTLAEWGQWEHNIREIFEQKNIARRADIEHIAQQLEYLTSGNKDQKSWITEAMQNAQEIDKLFLEGARKIVETTKS